MISIEFNKNDVKERCYVNFNKDCVCHVMLGPECTEAERMAVEKYLEVNGYGIDVSISPAFDALKDRR
jgi:hypothetical protein